MMFYYGILAFISVSVLSVASINTENQKVMKITEENQPNHALGGNVVPGENLQSAPAPSETPTNAVHNATHSTENATVSTTHPAAEDKSHSAGTPPGTTSHPTGAEHPTSEHSDSHNAQPEPHPETGHKGGDATHSNTTHGEKGSSNAVSAGVLFVLTSVIIALI